MNENIELPVWMIHQSFRYTLGRMTYAVGMFVDWAIKNWDRIPDIEKDIISRELKEAFNMYEKTGRCLGHDIDVLDWRKLLDFIENN